MPGTMFLHRRLEEKECRNPRGCSFITFQYISLHDSRDIALRWIKLDYIRAD